MKIGLGRLNFRPSAVLKQHAKTKKYHQACTDLMASFTPLIFGVDGSTEKNTTHFICHTAHQLKTKMNCPYAVAITWIRTRIPLTLIRATSWCVRGSRVKWRCRDSLHTPHEHHTTHFA
eukprot:GHVR01062868.1.p1 GENE.GHVR01062868.1~~GHVR01062868.1.p1  ORF type:complete len:119 (+),score=6.52 GHVR01062868.1:64-420(+)